MTRKHFNISLPVNKEDLPKTIEYPKALIDGIQQRYDALIYCAATNTPIPEKYKTEFIEEENICPYCGQYLEESDDK